MDIPITIGGKEHRLQSDQHNIMLCRKKKILTRNKVKLAKPEYDWEGIAFWSTLEGAVQGLLTLKVRGSEAKDLNQLQVDLKQYRDELKGVYE